MFYKIRFLLLFILLFLLSVSQTGLKAVNENDSLLNIVKKSRDELARIKAYHKLTYLMMWQNTDSAKKMLDSMERWILRKGGDEETCRLLNLKGSFHWFSGNTDSALLYYRKSREYSLHHELPVQYRSAVSNIGALFNSMGKLDSARIYLDESLSLNLQSNDSIALVKNYYDLGILYNNLHYEHLALQHLQWAAEYYEQKKDSIKASMVFSALGTAYQKIGNFQKAKNYTLKAIEYDMALQGINRLSHLYNNLGLTYWKVKKDYDSARYYLNVSNEKIDPEKDYTLQKFTFLTNIGGLEGNSHNYLQSFQYLSEAYRMKLPYQDDYKTSALLVNLGYSFFQLRQPDSARFYLKKGLQIALQNNANEQICNAYKNLFMVDSAAGNLQTALAYYKLSRDYSDSIENENVRNKIAELEIIHESTKKQKENNLLKTQNSLNEKVIFNQRLILIISLVSLTIIFMLLKS